MHVRETLMRLITIATFDLFRTCMFGLRILSMVFFYKHFFPNFPIPSHISPKFIYCSQILRTIILIHQALNPNFLDTFLEWMKVKIKVKTN